MKRVDVKERNNYILDLIKACGSDGVTSTTIETDCNISKWTRQDTMRKLMEEYPEIQRRGDHNGEGVYVWIDGPVGERYPRPERPSHSPFLKNRYEKTNKNDEGYTDMTATVAIKNVDRDLISPNAGEIWNAEESNGRKGYIYVLAFEDGAAQCIKLYDVNDTTDAASINRPFRVKLGAVTYIGDCARVTFKLKKYLVRRARGCKDEELMAVRKAVASVLDIQSFKIKEVPVEVPGPERIVEIYKDREVPEGCVDIRDAEIEKLKSLVEAWRSAFWGVAKYSQQQAEVAK